MRGCFFDSRIHEFPATRTVHIRDGKIEKFDDDPQADIHIPENTVIIPGGIDLHVHGREVYDLLPGEKGDQTHKENSYTLSLALAQGGATHAMCMPNLGKDVVTQEQYEKQLIEINSAQPHRPKPITGLSMYVLVEPESAPQVQRAMYKMMWNTFGRSNFKSDHQVPTTLKHYSDRWVTAHCETIAGMIDDKSLPHHEQRPKQAAIDAVKIFSECALKYGFHAHIAHISSAEELDVVNEYRAKGASITTEITPQSTRLDHTTFEKETGYPLRGWGQQNPPLRSYEDRRALQKRIKEVTILATDHAPHTKEENEASISGMPQADTAGQVYLELVTEGIISLDDFIRMRSTRPGEILEEQLGLKMGQMRDGYDASFTLVTLGKPSRITEDRVLSRCGWTPYRNMKFSNTIEGVIVAGELYTQAALQSLRPRNG